MTRILIRKIISQGWFSTKTELIDITDMPIEELWAMRTSIDRNESLEIILDKIIKRLPKASHD
jgi:predicted LPLAT superfamily acyltransferase